MKPLDKHEFDVSIVLNLHREAAYIARTLRSLSEAASYASHCGLRLELVIVFDQSDDMTRTVTESVDKFGFERVTSVEVEHGSLGLSRNSGISVAGGEYVWTADADDLVSFNCIERMHLVARAEEKAAIFPEYLIGFGVTYFVTRYFDDSVIETADFVYNNPYISRLFIRKDTFESLQYADLRLSKGFAYEDWLLNCELRARGYRFRIAPKTLLFYRQREESLLKQANRTSVGQIPHSTLFEPSHFVDTVKVERLARNEADFLHRRTELQTCTSREALLSDATCMDLIAAAVQIDPGINLNEIEWGSSYRVNIPPVQHWGHRFFDVCRLVGTEKFTDIVLLPWLSAGGGERFILDILNSLQDLEPSAHFLVISGESHAKHTWLHKLPNQSVFLDLYNSFPRLSEDERDQLALRTILTYACRDTVRLHLKTSQFAQRIFDKFSDCLDAFKSIYYRFSDPRRVRNGETFEIGYSFDFISNHLQKLWLLVTDHERIAISDRRRFGLELQKWQCLYAKHVPKRPHEDVQPSKRLLWASRVSPEKRPEILAGVASTASRLLPGISIDAFGTSNEYVNLSEIFANNESLIYKGGYLDFDELKPESYDALIYTSHFDGLPNVVIEAMSWGLPVIAPDLGGLPNAVMDGTTGYLLPDLQDDDAMCAAYAQAIQRLYDDWNLTMAMGQAAQELVRRRHSPEAYKRRVAEIFLEEQTG